MDSGNSGSMQSSSTAGDEDSYDSRADNSSISAFLFNNTNPPLSFPPHQNMLDQLSNYLDPDPDPRLDMPWSKLSRSQPNPSVPSSQQQNQPFLLSQLAGASDEGGVSVSAAAFHAPPNERGSLSISPPNHNNNNHHNNLGVRNPKKRSRASRRAPTTVLTTDTNNFRAMVQEFTGIPAPPFTSTFPSTRFHLFPSSSSSSSSSAPLSTPPYLLRPFPHKPQPPPIPSPSFPHMPPSNISSSSSNPNFHHLNMQNPVPTFRLQKYPPLVPSKTLQNQQHLEILQPNTTNVFDSHGGSVLEELGLGNPHVGNMNMVQSSSDVALMPRVNTNINNPSLECTHNNSGDGGGGGGGGVLRTLSGTLNNYRSNATASDFHGEKAPDCAVAARSQGTVDSWINCSSDTS